ncbi:hypothetical protein QMG90_01960 [Trabulsiella odontotermitis]|uniref:hypothetical protein n=1 Tax=Trabulsiella odontotermitis TaxID=379893 RepID=UPI0024B6B7C0|nr:hypothetical protein [Trabulsiella odontotermitis]WHP31738.1 hypothetical protein QMG90_01960 [Trabulsiella odontotermitis]
MIRTDTLRELIKEIDDEFSSAGVPIPHRTINCIALISQKLNVNLPISARQEQCYMSEGHKITFIISEWYKEMYGKRLNVNVDIGFVLLLIRGDLLICRVPNFVGTCNFLIEEDLSVQMSNHETNILLMINGMTQTFANSLSDHEKEQIFNNFIKGLHASVVLSGWTGRGLDMINAALNDLKAIESNMRSHNRHLGNAKWSYNQFIEKVIKSWLLKTGMQRNEISALSHNLEKAASKYNEIFSEKIDINAVRQIKGGAGLRYDEVELTQEDLISVQDKVFDIINSIGHEPIVSDKIF